MARLRVLIDESRDQKAADARRPLTSIAGGIPKRSAPPMFAAGPSTQMIVGADATQDATILETSASLYGAYRLRRVYYSAFSPIPHHDSGLVAAAPPLVREHRLYEADWLMRFYGFKAEELTTAEQPSLDLAIDPKRAWAHRHPEFFPVDVNAAPREALLRVPGIGYRNVARILKVRRYHRIGLADLRKLRVALSRARPFIIAGDWLPARTLPDVSRRENEGLLRVPIAPGPVQASLFAPVPALTGEL
jgi:predicted DNA-binding helix-hairpin-helix protein